MYNQNRKEFRQEEDFCICEGLHVLKELNIALFTYMAMFLWLF